MKTKYRKRAAVRLRLVLSLSCKSRGFACVIIWCTFGLRRTLVDDFAAAIRLMSGLRSLPPPFCSKPLDISSSWSSCWIMRRNAASSCFSSWVYSWSSWLSADMLPWQNKMRKMRKERWNYDDNSQNKLLPKNFLEFSMEHSMDEGHLLTVSNRSCL